MIVATGGPATRSALLPPAVGSDPHGAGSTGLHEVKPGELLIVPPGEAGPIPSETAATVAFRPSSRAVPRKQAQKKPRVETFRTGTNALEPTLGVHPGGDVFYMGGMAGDEWPLFPSQVMRSTNDGETWDDVTPDPPQDHVTTLDPYLYVDEDTGRLFTSDFLFPCSAVSHSDDAGANWDTTVTACELLDHQTIFAGRPITSEPVGYPKVVYYCAVDYVVAGLGVSCLKSLDGGRIFVRTGLPAFSGIEQNSQQCGWGSGHGVAGPDGSIYIPAGICSEPTLAISRDEGATWKRVRVADMKMGNDGRVDHDAAVAVDSENNLYYSWTGADNNPYLAVSQDGGKSWSKPVNISPPGVEIATLIALDVASPGNLAVSFVGSENQTKFGLGQYNGYMLTTTEALSRDPLFYAGRVNPENDPIDGHCSTGKCATNREFIDVAIAPDGSIWASFVDGCYEGSCSHQNIPQTGILIGRGLAARLVGGPRLR